MKTRRPNHQAVNNGRTAGGHEGGTILEITNNPAMREVYQTIERVASSDLCILITGEHGTGKEWIAQSIHQLSPRAHGPFTVLNCEALSVEEAEREIFGHEAISPTGVEMKPAVFEEASGGTLLLQEVAALSPPLQSRIARVIEYGTMRRTDADEDITVNSRIIASLSRPAETALQDGSLRTELYYRISPVVLAIPPLRERRDDIPLLIERFIAEARSHAGVTIKGISNDALDLCLRYDWPGNVRHLKNAIDYAIVMCTDTFIEPAHLPRYLRTEQHH